jgi:hypothetical protein
MKNINGISNIKLVLHPYEDDKGNFKYEDDLFLLLKLKENDIRLEKIRQTVKECVPGVYISGFDNHGNKITGPIESISNEYIFIDTFQYGTIKLRKDWSNIHVYDAKDKDYLLLT